MTHKFHSWVYSQKKKKKTKNTNSKDTCTLILTTALFTIAKLGKQPKWPSTDEWVRKMWHAHMSVCMCVCVCVLMELLLLLLSRFSHV